MQLLKVVLFCYSTPYLLPLLVHVLGSERCWAWRPSTESVFNATYTPGCEQVNRSSGEVLAVVMPELLVGGLPGCGG